MHSSLPVRRRASFELSNVLFTASVMCLCLAELYLVQGLWLRPVHGVHPTRGADLPFLIWIPALGAFIVLQLIRKRAKLGDINPSFASSLSSGLTILLLIAYLLLTRFAQIAFH